MKSVAFHLILLTTFSALSSHAQNTYLKSKSYEGVIFSKEYSIERFYKIALPRYTPAEDDIVLAERLVREQLPALQLPTSPTNCPVISKKLAKYQRQYFGFQDSTGSKILFINFIWREQKYANTLCKDIIFVFDGCSFYWQAKVNLTTKTVYDIHVNGSA